MTEKQRDASNEELDSNNVVKRKASASPAEGRQWDSHALRLQDKLKFCEPLMEEFLAMGSRKWETTLRRRPGSDPADFEPAVERWLDVVAGQDPEGGGFLVICRDKKGEPTYARGLVWSMMGREEASREGEELAGALSEVQMKQLLRRKGKELMRSFRETLFDALGPVNSHGLKVIATGSLRPVYEECRRIFEAGLADLHGSAATSESPSPRPPSSSGIPTLAAEPAASPADVGNPSPETDNNSLGESVGGDDILDPGNRDAKAAEEHAGDGYGSVDNAAGHEAERENDRHEGGGHAGGDEEHHPKGEGFQGEQSGPVASGSQLSLRLPSVPTKRRRMRHAA